MDKLTILSPSEILALPPETARQTPDKEIKYRRGFSHGFELAIQLIRRAKGLGYVRPDEIANMLDHYHSGPVLKWRSDKRLEKPSPFDFKKWSEVRQECLSKHPSCVRCGSNENLQIDHATEVREGGVPLLANLQTMCAQCHTEKTADVCRGG